MTVPGDTLADRFTALVEVNAGDVLGYLARRTDQPADAADALAAVLAIAWEKSARMPEDAESGRRWLFVIARHVLANLGRRRQRKRANELPEFPEVIAAIQVHDDALDVRDAVRQLAPKYREIVMLVHWDGFSLADAAAVCGIRASTARTRYSRARDQLRTTLAPLRPASAARR
ncbi:sigma-70 family RNA polymerase sigma factor [Herbiconiux sp. 11R-BC]|uniref:RNA polymerase sigma factor n=1 Tax=Herbiconiux sp. 11R-BC TaxID=3111637 RepID=UPI003C0626AB